MHCNQLKRDKRKEGNWSTKQLEQTGSKQLSIAYKDTMMAGNLVLWFSGCLACPSPWLHTQAPPTKRNSRNPRNTYKYHHIISNKSDKIIFPTAFVKTTKEQH